MGVVLKGCKEFNKSATIDPKDDLKDITSFIEEEKNNGWKFPKSYHITVLFIGGNIDLLQTEIFKNFHPEEKQTVKLGAIVVIPHKCVFGICFSKLMIANKIPHITLVLNHCPAKNSNLFGEALFLNIEELKKNYEEGWFEKDGEEYLNVHEILAEGKKYKAYLYKPKNTMTLYGMNKYFY